MDLFTAGIPTRISFSADYIFERKEDGYLSLKNRYETVDRLFSDDEFFTLIMEKDDYICVELNDGKHYCLCRKIHYIHYLRESRIF